MQIFSNKNNVLCFLFRFHSLLFRMGPRTTRDQGRGGGGGGGNFFRPEESHEVVDTWDNTIGTTAVKEKKFDGEYFSNQRNSFQIHPFPYKIQLLQNKLVFHTVFTPGFTELNLCCKKICL